jgi:hypothetical protein
MAEQVKAKVAGPPLTTTVNLRVFLEAFKHLGVPTGRVLLLTAARPLLVTPAVDQVRHWHVLGPVKKT